MDTTEENTAKVPYIMQERGEHGDLRIAVPSGYEGSLHISYRGFVSYYIAEVISLLTAVGILVHVGNQGRKRWITKGK